MICSIKAPNCCNCLQQYNVCREPESGVKLIQQEEEEEEEERAEG